MSSTGHHVVRHSNDPAARKLAALLFEYMLPGQRHVSFPTRRPPAKAQDVEESFYAPFQKKTVYLKADQLVKRFRTGYRHDSFERYVAATVTRHGNCNQEEDHGHFLESHTHGTTRTAIIGNVPPPSAVPFEEIYAEFRRSMALISWVHSGNNGHWIGPPKHHPVAREFLLSSDPIRQRMLLDYEQYNETCPLTKLFLLDLGRDYPMRIRKLLHRLPWLCGQTLKARPRNGKKTKDDNAVRGFTLTKDDAEYLIDLYRLPTKK